MSKRFLTVVICIMHVRATDVLPTVDISIDVETSRLLVRWVMLLSNAGDVTTVKGVVTGLTVGEAKGFESERSAPVACLWRL